MCNKINVLLVKYVLIFQKCSILCRLYKTWARHTVRTTMFLRVFCSYHQSALCTSKAVTMKWFSTIFLWGFLKLGTYKSSRVYIKLAVYSNPDYLSTRGHIFHIDHTFPQRLLEYNLYGMGACFGSYIHSWSSFHKKRIWNSLCARFGLIMVRISTDVDMSSEKRVRKTLNQMVSYDLSNVI